MYLLFTIPTHRSSFFHRAPVQVNFSSTLSNGQVSNKISELGPFFLLNIQFSWILFFEASDSTFINVLSLIFSYSHRLTILHRILPYLCPLFCFENIVLPFFGLPPCFFVTHPATVLFASSTADRRSSVSSGIGKLMLKYLKKMVKTHFCFFFPRVTVIGKVISSCIFAGSIIMI